MQAAAVTGPFQKATPGVSEKNRLLSESTQGPLLHQGTASGCLTIVNVWNPTKGNNAY